MVTAPGVHNLIRVDARVARRFPEAPAWVARELARAPWVIVRRETLQGAIAIGVRGASRAERFAASIAASDVLAAISPWDIDVAIAENERLPRAFALAACAARTDGLRVAPIGSFAYELVSGKSATHPASDLDLILDAANASRETLEAFRAQIDAIGETCGVHVDVELAYATGGVALREALGGTPSVLFKTAAGPRLLPCPV